MNKLVIGLGAALLVTLSALVTVLLTGGNSGGGEGDAAAAQVAEPENPFKEAKYFDLKPQFDVNFGANSHPKYMVLEMSASSKDQAAIDALQQHMPVIRNSLLMLFGSQDAQSLQTTEGKEALREKALACIQGIMEERFGDKGIDDVFFTRLVMQ
ncbi:MAG TPA: hypothetical protein ENJ84_06605 [Gammaproteobacteria bacterium]|nr:hypothetical protein [Gammaproteobacteria bacterium]